MGYYPTARTLLFGGLPANRRAGPKRRRERRAELTAKSNPSGSKAYRVDIAATITGTTREQRQFPTPDEAREYAKTRHLEITRFGHVAFAPTARQR
jgi:hypothetical protein